MVLYNDNDDNEYDLLNINFIQIVNYFSLLLQKVRSSLCLETIIKAKTTLEKHIAT